MASQPQSLDQILAEISSAYGALFKVAAGPFRGRSNTVYEIRSDGGHRWCLRVSLDADLAWLVSRGTLLLKLMKRQRPALRVPAVIFTSEHYTVLEYLEGAALQSWDTRFLARERRRLLLDQLAAFLFNFWTLDIPATDVPATSNLAGVTTYREWLQREVDRALRRSLQTGAWGDPIYYLYRRSKIDEIASGLDDDHFIVKHGDLNAWNIIVTNDGLSGVVDWDTAQLAPAPSVIQHPLFLANIPGWQNDVPDDMTFEEDRAYLERAIGKLEAGSGNPGRIEYLLHTSFERQFFELSLHNRRCNDEHIRTRVNDAEWSKEVALWQLDDFLSANRSIRAYPTVLALREGLENDTRRGELHVAY